jgi:hypothetical protein
MDKAEANKGKLLKFLVPIGLLFSASLWLSNKAYAFSSVAFLQFIKETNLTVVYLLSCLCGLQTLMCRKVGIIVWILAGCSLCVQGEIHFKMTGLILQVTALLCECTKNVMGEIVLTGSDLKLDPLTFNFFQAPLTFGPLCLMTLFTYAAGWSPGLFEALQKNWLLLLPNSMMAFVLNITLTSMIKSLSSTGFVLSGLVKDVVIVMASGVLFGDVISTQQVIGFTTILAGVACWSHVRLSENAAKQAKEEETQRSAPILDGNAQKDCEYGAARKAVPAY